ncbi:hypothetical protein ACJX0J_031196 [Zea mays]
MSKLKIKVVKLGKLALHCPHVAALVSHDIKGIIWTDPHSSKLDDSTLRECRAHAIVTTAMPNLVFSQFDGLNPILWFGLYMLLAHDTSFDPSIKNIFAVKKETMELEITSTKYDTNSGEDIMALHYLIFVGRGGNKETIFIIQLTTLSLLYLLNYNPIPNNLRLQPASLTR